MIKYLIIKNLILIDEIKINFSEKLNILSGETGSGKSIILDSINFLMGKKFTSNIIRSNSEYAFVETMININDTYIINKLKELNIFNKNIIVSRKLDISGKTTNIIDGKKVSLNFLKKFFSLLIDIHFQNSHQDILIPSKQLDILDKFCDKKLIKIKEELSQTIKEYKNILIKIKDISKNDINKTIENLQFEIKEIENCDLENENKILEKRKNIINNKILINNIDKILENLYSSNDNSALDKLSTSYKFLDNIINIDISQKYLLEILENIDDNLKDLIKKIKIYRDSLSYDYEEFEIIEEKYNLIYNIKRKYGKTKKDILEYYNKSLSELNFLKNNSNILENMRLEKKKYEELIIEKCKELSKLRTITSKFLENKIEKKLKDLCIENAKFKIILEQKKEFNNNGYDKVNFLISTNIGENLKPLAEIVSGGEISRIILALKFILSKKYNTETLIFDEIDTGVSGRTAQKIAENLSLMSNFRQIICITHLPQIAAMGDSNFLIKKFSKNNKTITNIKLLNKDDIVKEIARLISGSKITEYTMIYAKEMIDMADNFKNSN